MAQEPARKRRKVHDQATALPGFTKWNLEEDYERKARKGSDNKRQRLPLKTAEGRIVEQEVEDESEHEDEAEVDSGIANVHELVKPAKPKLSSKEEIHKAKEELARVAGLLSENPEEHIDLLGRLKDLSHSDISTVQKLALGTQLTVFKDIIPGYRIRPLAKDDLQGKVSKEVKKLRGFEQGLLAGYSDYVKTLSRLSRAVASSNAQTASVAKVAVTCMCNLITHVPHFNFRPDLVASLVSILSHTRANIIQQIIDTFESTFRDDEDGHISLDVVGQLTKMIKTKDYRIDERILNTFLHLRLLNEFRGKASTESVQKDDTAPPEKIKKSKREYRSKRERKNIRELKVIEKEMEQADAAVSHEERDNNQAETLKMVFITYFRILKARVAHLTGAVLEGLARYAHLINQDFFGDVLEVLRDLIVEAELQQARDEENEDEEVDDDDDDLQARKAVRQTLLCITTAFAMLQGQTDVAKSANQLNLDLNFFVTHLYRILPSLALDTDVELGAKATHLQDPNGLSTPSIDVKVNVATTTVLLLRSLLATLLPSANSRAVPPARVAAFTKQLLSASLHVPPKSAVALLGVNNQIAKTHGKKIAALWNTEERRGDGVFNPTSEEIEAANPFATTAWEVELLRLHFDPKVQEGIKNLNRQIRETTK